VSDPRAGLARKYGALVELRRRRDAGGDARGGADGPSARGGPLRALAAEFPGCLRELDTLGLSELERRAAAAASNAPAEPWMTWIAAYHALMRAALAVRDPARAAAARGDAAALAALATVAADEAAPLDVAFVAAVLAPPDGRVGVVVLRALAARFGVPATTIAATLFPTRRPPPYAL
jgi:hypothetical protein